MDWKEIDHKEFENLACMYAQDNYKEYMWIPTKKSHDGNRDGEFTSKIDSLNIIYKGWYEAKYINESEKAIAKSHMDSTLVSGILDGSVVFILFITNGRICKSFRRRAKAILTPYRINVNFVEGNILEQWLMSRPEVYDQFFNKEIDEDSGFIQTIEVDDICFLDAYMSPSALSSPIQHLIVNNEYYLYLSIRSNTNTTVNIHVCNDCLVQIPSKRNENYLRIVPGFNSFFIKYLAKHLFEGDFRLEISSNSRLTTSKIIKNFCIKKDSEPQITYGEQMKIIHEIYNYTILSPIINGNSILAIQGKAGTGKSYLLRTLLRNISTQNNDILIINFSDKEYENACSLCKLILFLNFGNLYNLSFEAFVELISNTVNLPLHLYKNIREGAYNQIVAGAVVKDLYNMIVKDNNYSILINHIENVKRDISFVIMDDVHKLSSQHAEIFKLILDEFNNKAKGIVIIMGFRRKEFKVKCLENSINQFVSKSWLLDSLSKDDIKISLKSNLNHDIAEIAALFPKPINILHLNLLIKKLIEKSIINLSPELQLICFKDCYNETNIQNSLYVKNKIKKCKDIETLFLIYKIESGITVDLLKKFFGEKCLVSINNLLKENLIRQENQILKPFHDVYVYAFYNIEYDGDKLMQQFLDCCLKERINYPEIESKLLSLLLTEHISVTAETTENIKKVCNLYYQKSRYIAAKILSKALLPDIDTIAPEDFNIEDLQYLYVFAMSIKYSEAHEKSNKYLFLICEIGKLNFLSSHYLGYVYEAYSEIINNQIWSMNKNEALKNIAYLEKIFTKEITSEDSEHKINAYLNLLNRKILYSAVFLNGEKTDSLYMKALTESKRLNRNDYIGYAMMDQAKNMLIFDMNYAFKLLNDACNFFNNDAYLKRQLDCRSEIILIKAIKNKDSFDELYQIQKETYTKGLLHVYAKTTLKILALELIHGYDIEGIELRLKKLFLQYPDMKNKHRLNALSYMLWAGIYHQKKDYLMQQQYAKKQLEAFKNMSESYRLVVKHNTKKLCGGIIWYIQDLPKDDNNFWIDPRLW